MTKIDSNLYLSNQQSTQTTNNGNYLGKDAFLKILMTQLQNQDPTNPMSDTDFIAQMAQFSSLEQMTNMVTAIDSLKSTEEQSQLISYSQFVGKTVNWHDVDEETMEIKEGSGKIASIKFNDGTVNFHLEDGTVLNPGNISEISTKQEAGLVEASQIIGKKVTWSNNDLNEVATVISVSMKNGQLLYELNNEEQSKITSDVISKISN